MSGLRKRLVKHRALAVMAAVYFLAVAFVVPPTDNYPLGDDWDYAATAAEFARTGRMNLGPWPAMTLVSHVAWGAAFLSLFGQSWTALAASSMVMAWIGGLAIYVLARDFDRPPLESALLCGCYVAAPLVTAFTYSFYTDVTATSLMLLTLAAIPRAVRSDTRTAFAGLGLIAGVAFLARQTAAVPAIVLVPVLLFTRRAASAGVLAVAAAVPVLGCYLWLFATDGLPSGFGVISYDLAVLTDVKGLVSKLTSILLEVGLLMFPAAVLRLSRDKSATPGAGRLKHGLLMAAWIGFVVTFAAELRPYRGWSFYDCGLGILPTYAGAADALRTRVLIDGISVFHGVSLLLAAVSVAVFVSRGWREFRVAERSPLVDRLFAFDVRLTIVLSAILYLCLLLILEFVYDRYLIPLIGLLLVLAATSKQSSPSPLLCGLSATCLLLLFAGSLVGVQDQTATKRVYWDAFAELRLSGVPLEQIEHGLVNVERTPEALFATYKGVPVGLSADASAGPSRAPRTAGRRWKLAFGPEPGWQVERELSYATWLRKGRLLVLRRE